MRSSRFRVWTAGLVAFLMGFPFSEKVFAYHDDILDLIDPSNLS